MPPHTPALTVPLTPQHTPMLTPLRRIQYTTAGCPATFFRQMTPVPAVTHTLTRAQASRMVGWSAPTLEGPAWTDGKIEKPLGQENRGTWIANVYTDEQQARLGVDKEGAKSNGTPDPDANAAKVPKKEHPFTFEQDEPVLIHGRLPPGSVYGMAVIGSRANGAQELGWNWNGLMNRWITFNQCYLMLIANYLIQGSFLYYFYRIANEGGPGVCGAEKLLQYVCLGIFFATIVGDFKETLGMVLFLKWMRTSDNHEKIKLEWTKDAVPKATLVSGMTVSQKFGNGVFIILPKLAIAAFLAYAGARYISTSPNDQAIIFRSVAGIFILKFDELLLDTFGVGFAQEALAAVPTIGKNINGSGLLLFQLCAGNWVIAGVISGLVYWADTQFCGA